MPEGDHRANVRIVWAWWSMPLVYCLYPFAVIAALLGQSERANEALIRAYMLGARIVLYEGDGGDHE